VLQHKLMMMMMMMMIIMLLVNPCSRILLEELHRQSRNSPYLKKSKVHKCDHKSTNNERNKNNVNRNSLNSEVTDYAMGDRGSFPGRAWNGLSLMTKTFPASNQAIRAENHCELKSPDRDAQCTPSQMSRSRIRGAFPSY
jgi:hypothetical protein